MTHRDSDSPPPLARPEFPPITIRADPPKILMLYGSLRERAYSRLLAEEAGRVLESLGCEVRFYDPGGLPVKAPALAPGSPKHRIGERGL